jgi:hypothetical protein
MIFPILFVTTIDWRSGVERQPPSSFIGGSRT